MPSRVDACQDIHKRTSAPPLSLFPLSLSPRLSISVCLYICPEPRLSAFDLGPNREAAAKLTLNKQGEALRWFYFPFEEEEGQDFSRPRTKAPPRIISPKLYCCGPPTEFDDMMDADKAERVGAGAYSVFLLRDVDFVAGALSVVRKSVVLWQLRSWSATRWHYPGV